MIIRGAIKIPTSSQYAENERLCKGDDMPCIVCGRPMKADAKVMWLRAGPGSLDYAIPHDAPDQEGAEMGAWPIGPGCLKRYPQLKKLAFPGGAE